MTPSLAAVIFDMDGVLLDSEPLHMAAMNAVLAAHGHAVDEAEYVGYIGDSAAHAWQAIVARRGLPEPVAAYVARYDDAVCAVVAAQAVPMPGLLPLLDDLRARGIPLAVGSTSPRRWIDVSLAAIGVRAYFDAVVGGDQVARGKPAPDVFLRAAALLGVAPAACVVLEDSPRGLQAAQAAGMVAVALQRPDLALGPRPALAAAALVVASLAAFQAWIGAQIPAPDQA